MHAVYFSCEVSSGWGLCVYLSSREAIVVFVFISQSKLLGEFLLHLIVRHLFTHSLKRTHPKYSVSVREQHRNVLRWTIIVCVKDAHSVYLVESLPLLVRDTQVLSRLDGATQLAGPDFKVLQLLLLHKPSQSRWKLQQGGKQLSTAETDPF